METKLCIQNRAFFRKLPIFQHFEILLQSGQFFFNQAFFQCILIEANGNIVMHSFFRIMLFLRKLPIFQYFEILLQSESGALEIKDQSDLDDQGRDLMTSSLVLLVMKALKHMSSLNYN